MSASDWIGWLRDHAGATTHAASCSRRPSGRRWTASPSPAGSRPSSPRLGLPRQRFHDLRHACASLMLAQGVAPRVVMETLGHSQIGLTLNTYSHVIPALGRAAADQMDIILAPRSLDVAAG